MQVLSPIRAYVSPCSVKLVLPTSLCTLPGCTAGAKCEFSHAAISDERRAQLLAHEQEVVDGPTEKAAPADSKVPTEQVERVNADSDNAGDAAEEEESTVCVRVLCVVALVRYSHKVMLQGPPSVSFGSVFDRSLSALPSATLQSKTSSTRDIDDTRIAAAAAAPTGTGPDPAGTPPGSGGDSADKELAGALSLSLFD